MKYLIVALSLFVATMSHAAQQREFHVKTAEGLVEICSITQEDSQFEKARAFCQGYIVGAYQYYNATVEEKDRFVCSPNPTPPLPDVTNGFVAWSKNHPEYLKERTIDTLFRYLVEKYPCGK